MTSLNNLNRRSFVKEGAQLAFTAFVVLPTAAVTGALAEGKRKKRLEEKFQATAKPMPPQDYNRAINSASNKEVLRNMPLLLSSIHLLIEHAIPTYDEIKDKPGNIADNLLAVYSRSGFLRKLSLFASGLAVFTPLLNRLHKESIREQAAQHAEQERLNFAQQLCVEDALTLKALWKLDLPISFFLGLGAMGGLQGLVYTKFAAVLRDIAAQQEKLLRDKNIDWTSTSPHEIPALLLVDKSLVKGVKRNFFVRLADYSGKSADLIYNGNAKFFSARELPGIVKSGLYRVSDQNSQKPDDTYKEKEIYQPLVVKPGQTIDISH